MACVGKRAAENHLIAKGRHVGLVAHQLHVPRAVLDAAIEHAADDFVVAQDDFLVETALGIVQRDLFIGLIGGGK